MGVLGGLGFAALFYAAAEYEHLTGWKWALASLAVTVTVQNLFAVAFVFVLPAQFVLFLALWWANARHKAEREVEMEAERAADRQQRQDRVRQAREKQVDPDLAAQQAARAAQEEAAARERQERVRRVREEREREERERAAREQTERDPQAPGP